MSNSNVTKQRTGREQCSGNAPPQELYASDEYVAKHPTLFAEHAAWKLEVLAPFVDQWAAGLAAEQDEVTVLDVGGGAGLILRGVAERIRQRHGRAVRKMALDLSGKMLALQREANPDLAEVVQGDITESGLAADSVDLTLMIDVIEHVPEPAAALAELKRVSRAVLFKAPLESTLLFHLTNALNRGRTRRAHAEELGHVQCFTAGMLRRLVVEHYGTIMRFSYANAFAYELEAGEIGSRGLRMVNRFCAAVARVAPGLAARVYTDFAVMLAAR